MNDMTSGTDTGSTTASATDAADAGQPRETTAEAAPAETGRALIPYDGDTSGSSQEGWFRGLLMAFGILPRPSLRDDLNQALAGQGTGGDLFSPEERAMLQNILRLRERRVEDVMVPRAEIEAVEETIPLGQLLQLFQENGHSRMPVYRENLDDPRGMVLAKDVFLHIVNRSATKRRGKAAADKPVRLDFSRVDLDKPLSSINAVRSVLFVPPSMLATDLMARMQATRTQMALVIDEYGGTDGLVTLEDIVEEVVGDIEDEHDDEEDVSIKPDGEQRWRVDARTDLDKVTEVIGPAFDPGERGEDVDTVGGLVFSLAGHIPVRGEVVRGLPGFEFRVLEADPRRVRRVQIVQTGKIAVRRKPSDETGAQQAAE